MDMRKEYFVREKNSKWNFNDVRLRLGTDILRTTYKRFNSNGNNKKTAKKREWKKTKIEQNVVWFKRNFQITSGTRKITKTEIYYVPWLEVQNVQHNTYMNAEGRKRTGAGRKWVGEREWKKKCSQKAFILAHFDSIKLAFCFSLCALSRPAISGFLHCLCVCVLSVFVTLIMF